MRKKSLMFELFCPMFIFYIFYVFLFIIRHLSIYIILFDLFLNVLCVQWEKALEENIRIKKEMESLNKQVETLTRHV